MPVTAPIVIDVAARAKFIVVATPSYNNCVELAPITLPFRMVNLLPTLSTPMLIFDAADPKLIVPTVELATFKVAAVESILLTDEFPEKDIVSPLPLNPELPPTPK